MNVRECPHCGSPASYLTYRGIVWLDKQYRIMTKHVVRCNTCGASGPAFPQEEIARLTPMNLHELNDSFEKQELLRHDYEKYTNGLRERAVELWNKREGR